MNNKKFNIKIIDSNDILNKKLLTPECQRVLDKEHVNELLNYQKEHYIKYKEFFLQILSRYVILIIKNILLMCNID